MSRRRYDPTFEEDQEETQNLGSEIIISGPKTTQSRPKNPVRRGQRVRGQVQPSQLATFWEDNKAEIIIIVSFAIIILLMLGISFFIHIEDTDDSIPQTKPITVKHPVPSSTDKPVLIQTSDSPKRANPHSKPASKEIPKLIWKYEEVLGNEEMWDRLKQNHEQFASLSGFTVKTISSSNYKDFVSAQTAALITEDIKAVSGKRVTNLWEWIKTIVLLRVLEDNGGILLYHPDIFFTTSLSWLDRLDTNPYVNIGKRVKPTQFFAFYNPKQSLQKFQKVRITNQPIVEPFRKVETGPAILQGFMAAVSHSPFVSQLVHRIVEICRDDSFLRQGSLSLGRLNPQSETMSEGIVSAVALRIFQARSKQLGTDMMGSIQDYGIALVNSYYTLMKMQVQMPQKQSKQIRYLSDLSQDELTANFGPYQCCLYLNKNSPLRGHLQRVKKGDAKIMKGSFLHRVFYSKEAPPGLYENTQVPTVHNNSRSWESLPKKVWVIWDKGIQNAKATNQMSVQHMRKKVKESGFQLTVVDNNNMKNYVKQETITRIEYAIAHAQIRTFPHTKPDLLRMALVLEHGGLYMDTTYVLLQNLDWLVNISKYPSQLVFNRYGDLPKIFFTFHPWYSNPAEWTIDAKANTKSAWHIAYENNFFATEPDNELLRTWFDQTLINLERKYPETQRELKLYGIEEHRWTKTVEDQYLMPMESLKLVVAKKQADLKEDPNSQWSSASEYYGIWSISGYLGAQKYRTEFNIDTTDASLGREGMLNYFLTQYSQEYAEGLVGKTRNMYKLYNWQNVGLENYIKKHYDNKGNSNLELHPRSLVMKTLLAEKPVINRQGTKTEVVYPQRPSS